MRTSCTIPSLPFTAIPQQADLHESPSRQYPATFSAAHQQRGLLRCRRGNFQRDYRLLHSHHYYQLRQTAAFRAYVRKMSSGVSECTIRKVMMPCRIPVMWRLHVASLKLVLYAISDGTASPVLNDAGQPNGSTTPRMV